MKASCGRGYPYREWWEKNSRRYSRSRPSLPYVDLVARRARRGDEAAVLELCAMLAPLAEGLVGEFGPPAVRRGLERDDLRQEAMCAIVGALRDWRPEKAAFRTFAFARARFAVMNALNTAGPVSMPRQLYQAARYANREGDTERRRAALAREKRGPMRQRTARAALRGASSSAVVSVEGRESGGEGYPAERWLGEAERDYEETMARLEVRLAWRRAGDTLTGKQRHALAAQFGLGRAPLKQREIGAEMGVTGQMAGRFVGAAVGKLRSALTQEEAG